MNIKFKIFILTFLLIIFSFLPVQAIDMFLNNAILNNDEILMIENSTYNNQNTNTNVEEPNNQLSDNEVSTPVTNPAPTVTHTSSSSSDNTLSISDIIDIILISVCIVLIFLGIAILIRCR